MVKNFKLKPAEVCVSAVINCVLVIHYFSQLVAFTYKNRPISIYITILRLTLNQQKP